MECVVCCEFYDQNQHKPFSINPCGHHFCNLCLESIRNNKCPTCRGNIQSKTLNRGILDLLSQQTSKETKNSGNKKIRLFKNILIEEVENLLNDWKIKKENENSKFKTKINSLIDDVENDKVLKITKIQADSQKMIDRLNLVKNIFNRDSTEEIENYILNVNNRLENVEKSDESKLALQYSEALKEEITVKSAEIQSFEEFCRPFEYLSNFNGEHVIGSIVKSQNDGIYMLLNELDMIPVIKSRTEARFQLEINDFSKFKESLQTRTNSKATIVGNLPWKISSMSLWNTDKESFVLGVFLQCDTENELKNSSVSVEADLKLLNMNHSEKDKVMKIKCLFKENEKSWGYSPFITIDEIMNKSNGFYDSVKDSITLEVCVNLKDPSVRKEASFQLVINDFLKFKNSSEVRTSSQPCMVCNLPWKILAMSKNMNNGDYGLGFFLQCNTQSESTRWSACATADLKLLHTTDSAKNLVKKVQHLFCLNENDWGFSPFVTIKEIMDPEKGYYDQNKDCITLEVRLNVSEVWHNVNNKS